MADPTLFDWLTLIVPLTAVVGLVIASAYLDWRESNRRVRRRQELRCRGENGRGEEADQ